MFLQVSVILSIGEGVGTGRRGCRIYELYLPPLDTKLIPYPSPPPLVLTSNGGHRITYGWQAGGMHPYWNAFLLDRRAANERRTACLLYNLHPLSSAVPVFTIQQLYIIAHFPRFV